MRRCLGYALLLAATASMGCDQENAVTLGDGGVIQGNFPAPGPNPEGYDNPGSGGGLPGSGEVDDTPPPPNPFNDFGGECSPPDGCDRDAEDWPDCLNYACTTGDCTYPGLADDYGYCTRACSSNEECENAVDGPYGAEFVCMTNGTSGTCVPGQGERCDRLANGQCDDENDACKWGVIYAPDNTYGGTCQPATEGGRDVGQSCDEEQGVNCANDLCLFGTCTSLCDPFAPADRSPCPTGWRCFDEFDIGVTLDICLPQYCERQADCPEGNTCTIAFEFNSETVLRGICLQTDPSQAAPGEVCTEERVCGAGACLNDEDGEGFCAGPCDTDADCGPNAYCDVILFGINADPGSAPAAICFEGDRPTGSLRACEVDADCAADGDNPQEACDLYLDREIEAGRDQYPPRISGRCVEIADNAVGFGENCSDLVPCSSPGLCLGSGGNAFCSNACRDSRDCGEGGLCFGVGFTDDLAAGACVPAEAVGLGGSLDACRVDADCEAAGETCQVYLIESTSNPVVELHCLTGGGAGESGAECTGPADCASGSCQLRSLDPAAPGFCQGPCENDRDCGAGFACERVRPLAGGNEVNLCRPVAQCAPCAFDGTAPCGGDYSCSQVRYGSGASGGACLANCDGPGDIACGDGFVCEGVIGGDGRATGAFACTPLVPDQVCGDARPR